VTYSPKAFFSTKTQSNAVRNQLSGWETKHPAASWLALIFLQLYRIASALQQQKDSGTDSVNARAEQGMGEGATHRSPYLQQSPCHPVATAGSANPRRINTFFPHLRRCRGIRLQGFALAVLRRSVCNLLHSTFVPLSGIFPPPAPHLTILGRAREPSLA
jgi:hypothetical protein